MNMVADLITISPSYDLATGSLAIGSVLSLIANFGKPISSKSKWSPGTLVAQKPKFTISPPAALFLAFGGFIAYQTTTLRFQFEKDSFALVKADGSGSGT